MENNFEQKIPNGTKVVYKVGYSYSEIGEILGYHKEQGKYFILCPDGKSKLEDEKELQIVNIKEEKSKHIKRAYQIWITGCILSLLGIFAGQFLGDFYKKPEVYYIVSGLWAAIMGGTSAALGFIIISKAKIK